MGSWNKTCGLTQLPIYSGERVITFLLVEKVSGYESYCYQNWAWDIIPLPIYGTYDDYGWMEVDAGQEDKLGMLKMFTERTLTRRKPYREGIADGPEDLGWNASDDVSGLDDKGYVRYENIKDNPFESFEALGESTHGNLFGLSTYDGKVGELAHMMIREDAFESLKAAVPLGDGYDPAVDVDYLRRVLEKHDAWKAEQNALVVQEMEDAKNAGNDAVVKKIQASILMDDFINSSMSDDVLETVIKPLRKEQGLDIKYDHACIDYWFLSYARYPSFGSESGSLVPAFLKKFKSFLSFDDVFNGYAIRYIFAELRKSYSPMGNEGSQNGTNLLTAKFPLAYLQASYNIDHHWDEDGEEYGEEDEVPDMTIDDEKRIELLKASANKKRNQAMKLLQEADEEMTKALLKKV